MRKAYVLILLLILALGLLPVHAQDTCNLDTQEAYIQRGNTERDSENYTAAIADYSCALALNDANLDALFGRAYAYYSNGEATKSEADYNRYLELDPNEGAAYNNRGNIYYDRGEYDKARADYNKAISVNYSEKYIPYYNLGNLDYQIGDYQAAIDDIAKSIDLDPNYSNAYLLRAGAYQAMNNDAALADIQQYVELIRQVSGAEKASDVMAGKTLTLAEGTVYSIPIEAKNGQEIRAAASTGANAELDPLLILLGPDGKPVAWDDDSGVNLDAVLRYTVTTDGSYTLELTHAGGGSNGNVKVTLSITGEGAVASTDTPANTFQVYDLAVNDHATVFASHGDHLNLRSGPGLSFDILAKLDRDTYVTLLEGPRKNDGYNWWRITTADGKEGWAVERVEEEQTLYPALKVGDSVVVSTVGDTLRVRSGAGRSFDILTQLNDGTLVTLLDGPQQADGLSWWKLKTADGLEGWAVESADDARTLIRADQANG